MFIFRAQILLLIDSERHLSLHWKWKPKNTDDLKYSYESSSVIQVFWIDDHLMYAFIHLQALIEEHKQAQTFLMHENESHWFVLSFQANIESSLP